MSDIQPAIDYTSKDYLGFRRLLLEAKRERMPEWTSESPSDFGVVLIEAFSYIGDILSFYGDRIANEAFITTATSRRAVLDIASMLDYRPTGQTSASVDVLFTLEPGVGEVTIPAGTRITTSSFEAVTAGDEPVIFETTADLVIDTDANPVGEVSAEHGVTVENERIGTSDGTLEQRFPLFQSPVVHRTPRVFVDEGAGFSEWTYFDRLIEARSNQNAFTTEENDRNEVTIIFGDGVNGRVPAEGAVLLATYRVGGGEVGNVGPHTLVEMPTTIEHVVGVTNPLAATGGAEAESTEVIRVNAPRGLRSLTRAVSLQDYADLAVQIPGVAKAKAAHPVFHTVVVYAAPFGGGPLSEAKTSEILAFFADRKLVSITVQVENPTYVPINISVDVQVRPEFIRAAVQDQVEAALVELLDFDRVDFEHLVALSHVYNVVNGVEGVSYATVTVLDRDEGTGVDNLQLVDYEIPVVGEISVTATGGIIGS